uniref:protein CHLOROPLAST IMPORT APPARATUS 2-like n=1 Tax=Erigeron canadensis TaxID=72917 RepID=UPI001CB94D18|nr:protein CHLOROPLAST IMPORT APPARATUS 2-like [Erigeron canadensis]
MSSYLGGGTGRAYGFDLENIVKSSSTTSSRTSHSQYSSSPSSTLSESSNVISTRKPRTPRKRPNQTYNEAAALLSTACPTIFSITKKSTNNNNKQSEFPNYHHKYLLREPLDLLLPFPGTKRPIIKVTTPRDIEYNGNWNCSSTSCNSIELGYQDDFDTESILDHEEIEEGIDSIMGNLNSISNDEKSTCVGFMNCDFDSNNTCYGYPIGLGFGGNLEFKFGYGLRNGVRALKNVDEGNWESFSAVNLINISSPHGSTKLKKTPVEKKKKVEDLMKLEPKLGNPVAKEESNLSLDKAPRLLLKLNYDNVLNAWSDKGSPLPEEILGPESPGGDIHAKLAQIDLFSENGGVREASVNRYKEKRQTRLFSKKIRYQVRKVNADRRPRSKGRFVRRPNPPICEET